MLDFFSLLFDPAGFPPRWNCGEWTAAHGWLHILSDLGIWSAYVAIPCVLVYFALRKKDLPYRRIFWLFGAFIILCGTTHLMEAIIFWWPVYRLAGVIKFVTALVSWGTVLALVPIVPQALGLRSQESLQAEIAERRRTEEALQKKTAFVSLLQSVAVAANEATSLEDAMQTCLGLVCRHMGWPLGHVYLVAPATPERPPKLTPSSIWYVKDPATFETFRKITDGTSFDPGIGLPGRVLSSAAPAWIKDVTHDGNFPRAQRAFDVGIRAACGFPLLAGDEVVAVIEIFSTQIAEPDEEFLEVAAYIGTQLGRVVERQRAADRLRNSEQQIRLIIDSAYDAFVAMDAKDGIIDWNPQATAIFGWSREEAIGRSLVETIVPPQLRAAHEAGLHHFLTTGEGPVLNKRIQLPALHRDGHQFPVELTISPILFGEHYVFSAFVQDITEKKQAEEALAERARLAAMSADVAVSLTRPEPLQVMLQKCADAIVQDLDAALSRIWTLNDADAVLELQASAGPYQHLDGPHRRVPLGSLKIGQIAQERRPHLTNQVVGDPRIRDQEWAKREGMVAFAGYPLILEDRLVGAMALYSRHALSPVTLHALGTVAEGIALGIERKRSEEALQTLAAELKRSNAELEEFASVASHDLQEPLRKIQAFGDRLARQYHETLGDHGREYLTRMQSAARRMRTLINDLLSFSRVTSKAQPFVTVDMAEVALEVVSDLEPRLEETGGRVEIGELATIEADPMQMRQLLQNLIGNALKFKRPDVPPLVKVYGRLRAPAQPRLKEGGGAGRVYEICVEDNGIGFDQKYLDRIFDVFQRLHGRGVYEGTGIGLAICRKIVERHRGTITARSVPGEGAAFIVELPSDTHPR